MTKPKTKTLEEKKASKRKFKKGSAMANQEDRMTELELRVEKLEKQ